MSLKQLARSVLTSVVSTLSTHEAKAATTLPSTTTTTAATMTSSTFTTPHVPIPPRGVDYRGKVVLAPMVRSGELPSRLLALKYGADLVWGPETVDRAIMGCTRKINPRTGIIEYTRLPSNGGLKEGQEPTGKMKQESVIYQIDPVREKGRLIFQIGSANPETAVEAAKIVAGDVSGIDLNAGCPKPFSTSGGMGAALLQTPDKLVSILENLVTHVGKPFEIGISVKIRILKDPEDTRALVSRLVKTGITGLTVHCRTTPMRPREAAIRDQLPMIREICHSAGVACLVNGDVVDRDHGLQLMEEYNVDGAMIATAAEANSSCFRSKADGGLAPWKEVVHGYLDYCMQVENRWGNTKYLLNMLVPGKGKDKIYNSAKTTNSYHDCCLLLGFDDLMERAKVCDVIVGRAGKLTVDSPEVKTQSEVMSKREEKNKAVERIIKESETARAAGENIHIKEKGLRASPGPGPIRSGAALKGNENMNRGNEQGEQAEQQTQGDAPRAAVAA
ncbi:tRNA dihydrouridine synthase [Ascosphaera apis ARSEF 7405]|uniref:tRNA dihydrouridine synthase n=1 Tax=Ascosphaera apis ARSEF 7405 TaxID=392613 RepID=A0A168AZ68_9EURO|nr:tRNA dihydrouridine synthase [Ascosphaera apis ARSEF 7405]